MIGVRIRRGQSVLLALATAAATWAVAPGVAAAAGACRPAITDLGDPFGGHFSYGDGVNASGAVAGTAALANGLDRATLWPPGRPAKDLGTVAPYDESFAHGLNDDGVVVGELNLHQRKAAPFIYSHGSMRQLPGLGGDFGLAIAVNEHGVVVGTASDRRGFPHAVSWTEDGRHVHDLGIAAGDVASFGTGINDDGTIVGDTDDTGDDERAALFTHGAVVVLPTEGRPFSAGEDINDRGRVVGLSVGPGGQQRATLWGPFREQQRDLGVLPGGSFASLLDVDDRGRAAGGGNLASHTDFPRAVVWPGSGPLLALRPLSGRFAQDFAVAQEIGPDDSVVGGSQNAAGQIRATVWSCAFAQAFRPGAGAAPSAGNLLARTAPVPMLPDALTRGLHVHRSDTG